MIGGKQTNALARVEFALDGSETVVWSVDVDSGVAQTLLGPFEEIFNVDPTAVRDISSFFAVGIHPEDLPDVEDVYRSILTEETEQVALSFRTHPDNGPVRWVSVQARIEQVGDTRMLTGVITDVTEWNARLQRVRTQNERLEQFAGVVSHDLRNPLSVAEGHVKLARERHDNEHLETAAEALAETESLVEDLLGAVDSGSPIIRGSGSTRTDVAVELSSLAETCWNNVQTDAATLDVETEATVRTDRKRLKQLLENLFRNAVEHGGDDVTVTIGDTEQQDGIFVADDGPGIPEADRDRIFESGYSTSESGFGLGLHIVDEIVQTQGWDLSVTESEDDGARFEVTGL